MLHQTTGTDTECILLILGKPRGRKYFIQWCSGISHPESTLASHRTLCLLRPDSLAPPAVPGRLYTLRRLQVKLAPFVQVRVRRSRLEGYSAIGLHPFHISPDPPELCCRIISWCRAGRCILNRAPPAPSPTGPFLGSGEYNAAQHWFAHRLRLDLWLVNHGGCFELVFDPPSPDFIVV